MVQSIEVLSVLKTLSSISCVISVLAAKVDLITIIEKAITSISTLALAVIAIIGYFSWKKQIKWKKKIEVLYETLVQINKIKNVFFQIRFPISSFRESESRETKHDEGKYEKNLKDISYIVFERTNKFVNEFVNFESLKYDLCIFYPHFEKLVFDQVKNIRAEILTSADMLSIEADYIDKKESEKQSQNIKDYEKIIFWSRNDEIDMKINNIISVVEAEYRKEVK